MEYLRDDMLAELATSKLSKLEIFVESLDTAMRSAKDLALAAMKDDNSGYCGCWRRCLLPGNGKSSGTPDCCGGCHVAGCCAPCELNSGHAFVDGEYRAWPAGALAAWPTEEQTVSVEAADMLKEHRHLNPEFTGCMEPPGRMVHISVDSGSARALLCDNNPKLGVSWAHRDEMRCIKLTPPFMLLDHFPNHVMDAVQACALQLPRAEPLQHSFSSTRSMSADPAV
mmetsp:Transcript_18400/g.48547  ORF Transcript_18400/g.48547 Transcript_18400/m.48547 type:complete len:226 (-) Transcript_18400:82-759(-)